MWYVKHAFDCIVVGASAVRGGVGPPPGPGSASQTAGVRGGRGGGGLFPHTAAWLLRQASFLQPSWCQGGGMWKTEHTGGPCSPTLNSPWAGIQTTCHTQGRSSGGREAREDMDRSLRGQGCGFKDLWYARDQRETPGERFGHAAAVKVHELCSEGKGKTTPPPPLPLTSTSTIIVF